MRARNSGVPIQPSIEPAQRGRDRPAPPAARRRSARSPVSRVFTLPSATWGGSGSNGRRWEPGRAPAGIAPGARPGCPGGPPGAGAGPSGGGGGLAPPGTRARPPRSAEQAAPGQALASARAGGARSTLRSAAPVARPTSVVCCWEESSWSCSWIHGDGIRYAVFFGPAGARAEVAGRHGQVVEGGVAVAGGRPAGSRPGTSCGTRPPAGRSAALSRRRRPSRETARTPSSQPSTAPSAAPGRFSFTRSSMQCQVPRRQGALPASVRGAACPGAGRRPARPNGVQRGRMTRPGAWRRGAPRRRGPGTAPAGRRRRRSRRSRSAGRSSAGAARRAPAAGPRRRSGRWRRRTPARHRPAAPPRRGENRPAGRCRSSPVVSCVNRGRRRPRMARSGRGTSKPRYWSTSPRAASAGSPRGQHLRGQRRPRVQRGRLPGAEARSGTAAGASGCGPGGSSAGGACGARAGGGGASTGAGGSAGRSPSGSRTGAAGGRRRRALIAVGPRHRNAIAAAAATTAATQRQPAPSAGRPPAAGRGRRRPDRPGAAAGPGPGR